MDTIGVSPADFLSGGISVTFDLERARGLRDFLQDDCAEVGDVWGEMIAEIERLRGFETAARDLSNDLTRVAKERDELQEANTNFAFQASDQAQEIGRLRAENAWLKSDREFQSEEQAARIKELEADLEQSERVIDQQAARIKSLKKEIRRLKHESKVEVKFTNSYIKRLHDAEARIEELESSLDEAETLTKKNAELMNGYLGRIAELEDALRHAYGG